jgi:hypothetical protein
LLRTLDDKERDHAWRTRDDLEKLVKNAFGTDLVALARFIHDSFGETKEVANDAAVNQLESHVQLGPLNTKLKLK